MSVLRRKAAAGKQEHQARAMTVAKAVRLSIPRVADDLMTLALSAIGIVVEWRPVDECDDLFDESGLLMLLEGPQGRTGAAILDQALANGIIQNQTMGRVMPDLGDKRVMTNTDAVLCAPLIEKLTDRAARMVAEKGDQKVLEGYTFGSRVDEARILKMAFEAQNYLTIRLTLDIEKGTRQGEMTLFLPSAEMIAPCDFDITDEPNDKAEQDNREEITDMVFELTADLKVELCRIKLPIKAISQLSKNDILPVPPGYFPKVKILGPDGQGVGDGLIGQINGVRALRLADKPLYAQQPARREADRDTADLPTIQDSGQIHSSDLNSAAASSALTTTDISREQAAILPSNTEPDIDVPSSHLDPSLENMTDQPGLVDLDLPSLDDFPDLAELDKLSDPPEPDAIAQIAG